MDQLRKTIPVVIALVVLWAGAAFSDSPVTSTPFADAYSDYAIVQAAKASGIVTEEVATYLSDEANPIDVRAAVVNALGWDINGKHNAWLYCQMRHRGVDGIPPPDDLRGDQALVIGYLMLMDDYFHPEKALPWLAKAKDALPVSLTVAMVHALGKAQDDMDETANWPRIWNTVDGVVDDEELNGDMRVGAVRIIIEYMALYKGG